MIRNGRAALILMMVVSTYGSPRARSDEGQDAQAKPAEDLDRILREWQAKAQHINSVEVRFRRTDQDKGWAQTRYECLAILAAPDLAMMESSRINADGKPLEMLERLIWNGRSILQFDMADRRVTRFPLPDGRSSPPGALRLPFFYGMTVEKAKQEYDWVLFVENEDVVILRATAKVKTRWGSGYRRTLLVLDRRSFLPKMVYASASDTDKRQTFEPIEIKLNAVKERADLEDPCLDAWTVRDVKLNWLTRWLFP